MRVAGDSYPRFRIRADGRIEWGSGSAALDALIYRDAAKHLKTESRIIIANNFCQISRTATNEWAITARVSGDAYPRLQIFSNGDLYWGTGSQTPDCSLGRRAANILNTPDRLEVGTLGVGNSAAATTPGNVVKKVEIFDDAGNSLGFLAVYDAIT